MPAAPSRRGPGDLHPQPQRVDLVLPGLQTSELRAGGQTAPCGPRPRPPPLVSCFVGRERGGGGLPHTHGGDVELRGRACHERRQLRVVGGVDQSELGIALDRELIHLLAHRLGPLDEGLLELSEARGLEELAEDLLTLVGPGREQFAEPALW